MMELKDIARWYKQLSGKLDDIPGNCEFCQAAPTKWVTVGNVVVFVCETHLSEFLHEVAITESPEPILFKSDCNKSGEPF